MEPAPCLHCAALFIPRNKKQYCCPRPECQRARKAAWQRIKIKTDPERRRKDQPVSETESKRPNPFAALAALRRDRNK